MKQYLHTPIARQLFTLVLSAGLMTSLPTLAANVALATSPLATSAALTVAPNLMLMLDDSGSMDWDYMPDNAKNFAGKYGYNSNQCNGVYYDPDTTYTPPIKADGTSYPGATFTAAWNDGYDTTLGTTNLSTSFKGGSGGGSSGINLTAGPAFYYTYTGTLTSSADKNYFSSTSPFYVECNTGSVPGAGSTLFPKVVPVAGTADAQNFANWFSYYSTRMMMMKTGVGEAFKSMSSRFRIGYMSMNNNNGTDIVDIAPFNATQKGNWYSKLYKANPGQSTPLRQALSQVGQLYANKFVAVTQYVATITVSGSGSTSVSSITVPGGGFELMAGTSTANTSTSTVARNIASQINAITTSPFDATVTGSVVKITGPASAVGVLPTVVSSGGMSLTKTAFAATTSAATQLNGITPRDPIEYSCQKNFVILSTDGYWNGNAGYKLDGTAVGNQDSLAPRPMYDGTVITQTTSQVKRTQIQIAQTDTTLQKRTTQLQARTSSLQSQTSQLQTQTSDLQSQTSQLQTKTSALQSQTSQLQTKTSALQSQTSQLQTQTSALQSQTSQFQTQTSALQSQTSQLQTQTSALQSQTSQLQISTSTLQGTVASVLLKCNSNTATCGTAPITGVPNATWVLATACTTGSGTAAPRCAKITPSPAITRTVTTTCNTAGSINGASPYTATNTDGGYLYSSCSYTAWSAWGGTPTCTAAARSGGSPYTVLTATQCQTVVTSAFANAASCTVTTPNGSGLSTQCAYTAMSAWGGTPTCSAVSPSPGPTNYTVGTARNCQTAITSPYANAATCTVTTPDASGLSTQCAYTALSAWSGTPTCTGVSPSPGPTNYTVGTARNCQTVVTAPFANAASCTASAIPNASGYTTQCLYTAYSAWAATPTCTAAAQSGASPYTVGTARNCQTVVTVPFANAASCTASTTPSASGNTTQCAYTPWSTGVGSATCTPVAQSTGPSSYTVGTAKQCATVVTSAYANAASCTVNAVPTGSGNTTQCAYTAWSAPAGVATCTAVAQSPGPTSYSAGTARQCATVVTALYANAPSCTVTVPDASGLSTQCAYSAWSAGVGSATCTATAKSVGPTNYSVATATQCSTVVTSPYANTASCTTGTTPDASGNTTQCQYTALSAWSNTNTCTAVAPTAASPYTVGTATECQTTDTGFAGAGSCTPSTNATGQVVTCNSAVTGGSTNYVASCTPVPTAAAPTYTITTCTTTPYGVADSFAPSCALGTGPGPSFIKTTVCTPVNTGPTTVASCVAETASASNNYKTTTCTGGAGGTVDTLADTAMYYYQTDLRDTSLNNCTGVLGAAGGDVCENNVRTSGIDNNDKQHLTTFTLGLGARGRMAFSSTYLADTSGDFYDVKKGTPAASPICSWQTSGACNWPAPPSGGNDPTTIDDLWHASVNGRGNYFNATDPKSLSVGLSNALKSIDQVTGAAAAAATSTLNPVAANNFAYVASYTTVKWSGNLEQRTIDTTTGSVSQTAGWCIENIAPPTCIAPYSIVKETSGSSNIYYCSVVATDKNTDGVINAADCTAPDVFTLVGTTNVCRDQIQNTCLGTLPPMVAATSDTRLIKTANSTGNGLVNFDAAYATANPTNFSVAHISGLTQWPAVVTAGLQTTASGTNLINFLRGQNKYEESRSADSADWLFRFRDAVFGDALESQPTYIGAPTFAYLDPGYSAFAANNTSRAGTVFIGANDGMLHAFAASNGVERWAYVPSMIIPNMWKLADTNYSIKHVNYVNGTATISDVCFASCTDAANADWRTILVGGLNAGGRGYFALDVTNPTSPNLLWEFKATSTNNLGYSYGRPVITKKQDGTWVVLISSGYDNGTLDADNVTTNSPTGNGGGYLYVLNALDGTVLSTLPTGVGTAADPSGFAKFEAYSDVIDSNQAGFVYGGDLKGNLWRFNINAPAATNENPLLFATFGATQPITVAPTLAKIKGSRVIIVGTGKYLETPDLSNTSSQSLYAIKDDNKDRSVDGTPFGTLTTPRSTLVQQTIATAGSVRSSGTPVNTVDFNTGRGWFIDFPDSGERANISAKLVQGTLIVPTIVPSNSLCSPGGYGWLNFFNYETGAAVDATNVVSQRTDSTIVGINVIFIDHQPVVDLVTSSNPTPERLILRNRENCVGLACDGVPFIPPPGTPGSFKNQRQTWRELTP